MKEVISQSKWVGKILTCEHCQKSFEVESGDILYKGFTGKHKSMPAHFVLNCGHIYKVEIGNPITQTIDEYCGKLKGSFAKFVEDTKNLDI